ncbi:MAG: glucuronyl hydrolase [Candidatus Marinimicrobia bacterium]|jgi:rhamnogalacturonyl hydrolase YesR|nr:glucuronyl hydrolase [Candidatus Neomarinimicrobiota bacterium]MBT3676338.1 glucuronyl hydrolase [Candidatus Neomarinimicrobiota bacterium]MBT3763713.1 glucuronyl hydrolase [Candidatus Neomarinimicrobiota bacterium]MBT4067270.1 glucuronyl hydrolase [Candidatus Neomarinimicrobiota bacterium]MBT4271084.1 glucuronyl hydrolase [Candidatus Neomarinimicrobiota bacterium]
MNYKVKFVKSKISLFITLLSIGLTGCSSKVNYLETSTKQYGQLIEFVGDSLGHPRTLNDDGSTKLVNTDDWTSGFWPGSLWYLYELTDDEKWRNEAQRFTVNMAEQQFKNINHDIGFKMNCSYGNGYRLTQNPDYVDVLIQSAKTLALRFDPNVGCIRSWDFNQHIWGYPVIIDNMMNLELLFKATKLSGDSIYYHIAVSHAETTLKNHFRPDNSSYHVVDYNQETGAVWGNFTHQGFSRSSAWARGQAWGLYGFTMTYRETGDKRFLDQAKKIADFILNHPNLPNDLVPYWDFNAGNIPEEPRDVSAAAIICSALFELSEHLGDEGNPYLKKAQEQLHNLSNRTYLAKVGSNGNFLLKHAVGSIPHGAEVDKPLNYADYYFLEAQVRNKNFTFN